MTPPKWISVEERYPEVDQDVVYFFDICGTYVGKYLGEHCFAGEAGFLTDDVTHWMPYRKPKRGAVTTEDEAPDMSGVMFLHRWMRTRNPFLGDIEPLALLKMGKGDRLAQFIESAFHAETRDGPAP